MADKMLDIVLEAPNKISITIPKGEGGPARIKRQVPASELMKLLAATDKGAGDGDMYVPGWQKFE
ncbi:MAG: hypothetical protein ACE141_14455 [Bryobacteraceae bacterium]